MLTWTNVGEGVGAGDSTGNVEEDVVGTFDGAIVPSHSRFVLVMISTGER